MNALLYEVDTSAKPVKLKNGIAAKFKVFELSFSQFAKTIEDASRAVSFNTSSSEYTKAQRAERRKAQVKAYDAGGTEVPFEDIELRKLPRPLFSKITAKLDQASKIQGGEIVTKGDGADTPIIFKLGSGLIFGANGVDQVIYDLEFQAKTGDDIEPVLCAGSEIAQTLALIEWCSLPLAKDLGLQKFPDMMLDQITMNDGIAIMRKVLPSFLE